MNKLKNFLKYLIYKTIGVVCYTNRFEVWEYIPRVILASDNFAYYYIYTTWYGVSIYSRDAKVVQE